MLQNKKAWNQAVKTLNLTKEDRMILGHLVFGRTDEEAAILIGTTEERVTLRRKEIMAKLGDLGLMANENMIGLSLYMTMIEGLNANLYDKNGKEMTDRPDMKARLATIKIFDFITGGLLGRLMTRFADRVFENNQKPAVVEPPEWLNTLDPQSRN